MPRKNWFFHSVIRCHQAEKAPRENVASNSSDLPNPYGEDTTFGQKSENALNRRVRIRDSQRVLWTRISTIRGSRRARTLVSVLAILATIIFASGWSEEYLLAGVALFAIQATLFFPTLLAASFAQMSARDRLQLKIGSNRSMAVSYTHLTLPTILRV